MEMLHYDLLKTLNYIFKIYKVELIELQRLKTYKSIDFNSPVKNSKFFSLHESGREVRLA